MLLQAMSTNQIAHSFSPKDLEKVITHLEPLKLTLKGWKVSFSLFQILARPFLAVARRFLAYFLQFLSPAMEEAKVEKKVVALKDSTMVSIEIFDDIKYDWFAGTHSNIVEEAVVCIQCNSILYYGLVEFYNGTEDVYYCLTCVPSPYQMVRQKTCHYKQIEEILTEEKLQELISAAKEVKVSVFESQ